MREDPRHPLSGGARRVLREPLKASCQSQRSRGAGGPTGPLRSCLRILPGCRLHGHGPGGTDRHNHSRAATPASCLTLSCGRCFIRGPAVPSQGRPWGQWVTQGNGSNGKLPRALGSAEHSVSLGGRAGGAGRKGPQRPGRAGESPSLRDDRTAAGDQEGRGFGGSAGAGAPLPRVRGVLDADREAANVQGGQKGVWTCLSMRTVAQELGSNNAGTNSVRHALPTANPRSRHSHTALRGEQLFSGRRRLDTVTADA